MAICAACGRESPDDFGFCPSCGAALAVAPPRREVRKVVTVLFCDLIGSTALGDRTDPEMLRILMRRYYETTRAVLERHGGTVEKFVGDAVMAIFGVPVATEDDALRAVRAAVEIRDVVRSLGLDARIGVNTGEVVSGEGDTLVTGDAVNVAARLEQAAGAGDVLLGHDTARLVRDAVDAEVVELSVKGKPDPIVAHRLVELRAGAAGVSRRMERPIIGRARERERLRSDFADAAESRTTRLFTLIGPAGVGKSRLVADFLEHAAAQATVARGRALSYGDGITYWPLLEIFGQLGIDPTDAIRSSPADTQLASRALLERVAEERPLIVVIDDIQWAEPPLLDLVEHVADWSRDAPIFLLCIARPELLDVRPGWGGGKMNATSILLEPLPELEAGRLADELLRDIELPADTRERIMAIAEGNPLFLEEMAALAREAPGPLAAAVPPTIHAVLQARLDTLKPDERAVIERGAVEGKVFHRGAVTALAPTVDQASIGRDLIALVRKELVRQDRSQIEGDDAFRFRHLLIRDTAYDSLPKSVRADLHERFATWLDRQQIVMERDEIVGYHLERAVEYLRELDEIPRADALAERAAHHLGSAGSAAMQRGDLHAARTLLGRAVALLPESPHRRALLPDFIAALAGAGDSSAPAYLDELERGGALDRARATALRILTDPLARGDSVESLYRGLASAHAVVEADGTPMDVVRSDQARGILSWLACRADDAVAAYRRAYERLRTLGQPALLAQLVEWVAATGAFSGATASEMREIIDRMDADLRPTAGPLLTASLDATRARGAYFRGEITADEARGTIQRQATLFREIGSEFGELSASNFLAVIDASEGDAVAAERRRAEIAKAYGRLRFLPLQANALAEWSLSLSRIGEWERALAAVAQAREVARPDDIADGILMDLAEASALGGRGDYASARELVDRARRRADGIVMVLLSENVDFVDAQLRLMAGDPEEAARIGHRLVSAIRARGGHRWADALQGRLGLDHDTAGGVTPAGA